MTRWAAPVALVVLTLLSLLTLLVDPSTGALRAADATV